MTEYSGLADGNEFESLQFAFGLGEDVGRWFRFLEPDTELSGLFVGPDFCLRRVHVEWL